MVSQERERRVNQLIEERVAAAMQSEVVQQQLQQRLIRERQAIEAEVRQPTGRVQRSFEMQERLAPCGQLFVLSAVSKLIAACLTGWDRHCFEFLMLDSKDTQNVHGLLRINGHIV